jgi:hypothetical protein
MMNSRKQSAASWLAALMCFGLACPALASDDPEVVKRDYSFAPPAPEKQTTAEAEAKSRGCMSCHATTDALSMHANPGVVLGCTDCHGGDASVSKPEGVDWQPPGGPVGHGSKGQHHADAAHPSGMSAGDHAGHDDHGYDMPAAYRAALDAAHVQPLYPDNWHYPRSASPQGTYTLLNLESPEFIRFMNPSDYRVARESCGACHMSQIHAAERSIMATGAMLWGGASYNNGILPFKQYVLGEYYVTKKCDQPKADAGDAEAIKACQEASDSQGDLMSIAAILRATDEPDDMMKAKGVLEKLAPLPAWEVLPPADVFRVFERGGRNINSTFPETGLPNSLGQIQRLEEPGRPDIKQSNRGPGTGARIAVPVINIHKTRLNDPFMWFLGTNDNPGDHRSSGCASCHVVYANDRDPRHSGPYAVHGHNGETITNDPTIPKGEKGHPLKHEFTRSIPTSQCMICHMHQPNVFVNSFLGYTMWDYESDAPRMWPDKQRYVSHDDVRPGTEVSAEQILGHEKTLEIANRNPEEAAQRGLWGDLDFLRGVWDNNSEMQDTQFADYHGHGWNFRAIFKRDRKGTLLDAEGKPVSDDDPDKWKKAVHMSSIHVDVGMHCVDCHFEQDTHGNGHMYGEVAQTIEIDCADCHGTADEYPNLRTSGPAAPPGGTDLGLLLNQDGKRRFEWRDGKLYQRSALWADREWELSLVKDSVNPDHPQYNAKAARAKLMSRDTSTQAWGLGVAPQDRAHKNEEMTCFSCHSSWTTSCGGCHLPIQANWKTRRHHYDFDETRNFATYNPQVARDQMYQLGRHGPAKGGRIAPIRSSSALVLSSRNSNRELIYIQQAPIAASGFSSQAFAPHFPHTTRKEETKTCTDCHLSEENDNNAIMAQLLLHGTNYVNFVGYNAWVGTEKQVAAVRVTEWDEPQAVIGSYLHRYAYPDWWQDHQDEGRVLRDDYLNMHTHSSGPAKCLQLRGEYLYVAEGSKGMRVYDVANIANKGISQRIITAPFSPLGHDTHVDSADATCVVLPTTQPIHPNRQHSAGFGLTAEQMLTLMRDVNLEQDFHPIYDYAFITDSREGLIAVDVNTLSDGEPRNNFLKRALTWNENGILDGARHLTIAGRWFYVSTQDEVIVLDMNNPLAPQLKARIPLPGVRATALQFRYLFAVGTGGMQVVDVTNPWEPRVVPEARVPLAEAYRVYLARTYAYVAAGSEGLAIIDVERPEQPKLFQRFDAGGVINDARDVIVGTTNASAFAYVADGVNGLRVIQLTSPERQPKFYGFSPEPNPELIASRPTKSPALALSKGLDRDRAVDESGGQIAVLGRIGSRPFNEAEQRRFYTGRDGKPWYVTDKVKREDFLPARPAPAGTLVARGQAAKEP